MRSFPFRAAKKPCYVSCCAYHKKMLESALWWWMMQNKSMRWIFHIPPDFVPLQRTEPSVIIARRQAFEFRYADIKSVTENTSREALKRCRVQSKYAGRVTDVHKGIVYVRLSNGVNAVAHSCYDRRTPGKKDDVSFVVTKLDEERSIAVGIITRIIRQNL